MNKLSLLYLVSVFQDLSVIRLCNADDAYQIAFNCGRPSMIFQNGIWIPDYQQKCIKDELGILSYCRRKFFNKIISSAEPANEKINFSKWCDFEGKNCELNVQIRPFRCLESNVKSNLLIMPKNCEFGTLSGDKDCKLYKDWVIDASNYCSKKPNWQVRSYGMLFQCGKSNDNVKPMSFRGVEFVCCPKEKTFQTDSNESDDQKNMYHPYISNGVLESEEEEDNTYGMAFKNLNEIKIKWKKTLIDNYRKGEEKLKKMFINDPRSFKEAEHLLISKFKSDFWAMTNEMKDKEEKLLHFHVDRRKTLFKANIDVAKHNLDEILERPDKKEIDIRNAMIKVLSMLMTRKRQINEERTIDRSLNSQLIPGLIAEAKMIDENITKTYSKLDKVPQLKKTIKQYILMYLMTKFPRITFEKVNKPDDFFGKNSEINKIIAKYKYKPGDPKSVIFYDLSLKDKDQIGHGKNSDHKISKYFPEGQKNTFIILLVVIAVCILLILISVTIVFCYKMSHRRNQPKYRKFTDKPMVNSISFDKQAFPSAPISMINDHSKKDNGSSTPIIL